jgi:hypothetical protein
MNTAIRTLHAHRIL